MALRKDGSIQSANLPTKDRLQSNQMEIDYGIYRGLVIRRYFTDDAGNPTFDNKQVTYDVMILGGRKEGQTIPNCKLANSLGGQYNYQERILRPAQNPVFGNGKKALAEQKGDIVYVSFVGKTSNPVIIGLGTHPLDKTTTGATASDGMRMIEEYNGVFREINKDGDLEIVRKGGVYDPVLGYFVPADRSGEEENGRESDEEFQARFRLSDDSMLWEDPNNSMEFLKTDKKLITTVGKGSFPLGDPSYTEEIDGDAEKATITFKSGMVITLDGGSDKVDIVTSGGAQVTVDGSQGSVEAKDNGTGALKIQGSKVGLGAASAELVEEFVNLADKLITLTQSMQVESHLGNLGYPTGVPINAPAYLAVNLQITIIKALLTSIKGGI